MLTITGGFSGFSVNDLPAALAFYRDTLGLDAREGDMGDIQLQVGGTHVFVYPKDDHQPATYTVLNLEVADIDVGRRRARGRGRHARAVRGHGPGREGDRPRQGRELGSRHRLVQGSRGQHPLRPQRMSDGRPRRSLPRAARPFRHGQYRILAFALVMSLFGAGSGSSSMVFEIKDTLGGGPIEVSYVATANAVGLIVATLIGGAIADRVPQKRILVAIETTKTLAIGAAAVLAVTGNIEIWHLIVVAIVLGLADGFFYPAYSALLPSILPADDLLAANGVEGMLRPVVMQALGPAIAGLAIAIAAPAWGFVIVTVAQALAVAGLLWLKTTPVRRELDEAERARHPVTGMFIDIKDGFVYMVKTPWLLGTLLFASVMVFVIIGPIDVLLPFVAADQAEGGPGGYALVLAAFGFGGAIASLVVASLKLPRRYLTVMTLVLGRERPAARRRRIRDAALADRHRRLHRRSRLLGRPGDLGHPAAAPRPARDARPGLEPRLLRVTGVHADLDGRRRPARRTVRVRPGIRGRREPCRSSWRVITIVVARMPRDEIENPLDQTEDMGVGAAELLEPQPDAQPGG